MGAKIIQAQSCGIGDEESKDPTTRGTGPDLSFLLVAQSDRHKLVQGCAGLVQDPERPEAGLDQIARLLNQVAQQFRQVYIGFNHKDGGHQSLKLGSVIYPSIRHWQNRTQDRCSSAEARPCWRARRQKMVLAVTMDL
jgi:hypothetical protein